MHRGADLAHEHSKVGQVIDALRVGVQHRQAHGQGFGCNKACLRCRRTGT